MIRHRSKVLQYWALMMTIIFFKLAKESINQLMKTHMHLGASHINSKNNIPLVSKGHRIKTKTLFSKINQFIPRLFIVNLENTAGQMKNS